MKLIEFPEQTVVIAQNQKPYHPLPAHQFNDAQGRIACCWKLSWRERVSVLFYGLIWHQVLTFNKPLQPQLLTVEKTNNDRNNAMSTETAITVAPSLELTATTPLEMQESQSALIKWCEKKIEVMKFEAAELAENLAIAIKNKWRTITLKRHTDLATKRVTFYEKIKAALEAGYCIVPNFPVTVFAIRTDREKPLKKLYIGSYQHSGNFTQEAKLLPEGEGEYKDPEPFVRTYENQKTNKDGTKSSEYHKHATDFDEIDFPINMAKPRIMEATSRAMALKVFDEMGVLPDPHPKKDPLIVGRILDPRPTGYGPPKSVSFIIAWHLNVRDL